MTFEQLILIIYIIILGFMSILAFFTYGIDKNKAKNGGGANRIKESTLLGLAAFGGAVGSFIGRIIFRHKTDKLYFSLTIYFSLLIEAITLAILVYFAVKGVSF